MGWRRGRLYHTVVTDEPYGNGQDDGYIDFYGGYLVGESIFKKKHRDLIIAAPELLEALELIVGEFGYSIPQKYLEQAEAAIKKAKGA